MRKGSLIVVAVVLTALLVACGTSSRPVQPDKGLTIAVIPKGTTHVFWKSVEAGARKAGGTMLSEATIARMLRSGEIKGQKIARDWLIDEAEAARVEGKYPLEGGPTA